MRWMSNSIAPNSLLPAYFTDLYNLYYDKHQYTMKTIPYTRIDAIIQMMPQDNMLRGALIESHAKDILLKRDIEMLDNDYQFLAKHLPLDAVCMLMRESLIDGLKDVKQNNESYSSISECLIAMRENEMILAPVYIALVRLLAVKTIDELLKELENETKDQ